MAQRRDGQPSIVLTDPDAQRRNEARGRIALLSRLIRDELRTLPLRSAAERARRRSWVLTAQAQRRACFDRLREEGLKPAGAEDTHLPGAGDAEPVTPTLPRQRGRSYSYTTAEFFPPPSWGRVREGGVRKADQEKKTGIPQIRQKAETTTDDPHRHSDRRCQSAAALC